MTTNNVLYIADDMILLKNKKYHDIIITKLNKKIVSLGRIANITNFMKEYENILKTHNLNNSILGETIKIIVGPDYTNTDITILKNIFTNFNYRKIYIIKETKLYKLKETNAYLNVYDNYQHLIYLDKYKKVNSLVLPTKLFKSSNDLMKYIKYIIEDKELYLLGSGELLKEIFNTFEEQYNNKTYLFSNHSLYLITKAFS